MAGFKQSIVLRQDLGLSEGKKISQACHACLGAFQKAGNDVINSWQDSGAKKVALKADDEETLRRLFEQAKRKDLPAYLVTDAGRTELEPGTVTCLGVGPADENDIDAVTGELELI
ncbi:MAG: peptidyl-tRNA hydrolase Pth2 [Candidatus Nanohaloarchaea archaeon]|nr:peptidyl-tRNA hydrolase Pth2 [Candidatus Nanohaloarchaea archaeon]